MTLRSVPVPMPPALPLPLPDSADDATPELKIPAVAVHAGRDTKEVSLIAQ